MRVFPFLKTEQEEKLMVSVIFEVWPDPAHREGYLNWAAELKTELLKMDGFISIERFQSLSEPDKLLSLQFWRDESCLQAWRNLEAHRAAQSAGRSTMFRDYRLRIAEVIRDYGLKERDEAPADSRQAHG
jgi:heme-degrading monooxygenase HmoA